MADLKPCEKKDIRPEEELKAYIDNENVEQLRQTLDNGYPEDVLKKLLFYAADKKSWRTLDVLIQENSAKNCLHSFNQHGENILHRIMSQTSQISNNITARCVCKILSILQQCMDAEELKVFVAKIWVPQKEHKGHHKAKMSPLHMAVEDSNMMCVVKLLECGADPNYHIDHPEGDYKPKSLLMTAALNKNIEIIDKLLAAGASVSAGACAWSRDSTLTIVFNKWSDSERGFPVSWKNCLLKLLEAVDIIQTFEYRHMLDLMEPELLEILIKKDFPIVYKIFEDDEPMSYLLSEDARHWAFMLMIAEAGYNRQAVTRLAQAFQEHGIDINRSFISDPHGLFSYCNIRGCTVLQTACHFGYSEIVSCLLHFGADPDVCGELGRLAILHVLEYQRMAAMKCVVHLLRFGCELNVACPISIEGRTSSEWMFPIDYFLMFNQLFIVRMMMAAGASKFCPELHIEEDENEKTTVTTPQNLQRQKISASICKRKTKEQILKDLVKFPTLYHLCRITVRSAIQRDIENKIESLPLPNHIKSYLNLVEIEEIEKEYSKVEWMLLLWYSGCPD